MRCAKIVSKILPASFSIFKSRNGAARSSGFLGLLSSAIVASFQTRENIPSRRAQLNVRFSVRGCIAFPRSFFDDHFGPSTVLRLFIGSTALHICVRIIALGVATAYSSVSRLITPRLWSSNGCSGNRWSTRYFHELAFHPIHSFAHLLEGYCTGSCYCFLCPKIIVQRWMPWKQVG